jgi:hypothetical protein
MKQLTYMLYYKDSRGKPSHFFGPFVSERLANEFADELPDPCENGVKSVYPVSQYTSNEANLAAQEILQHRI